MLASLTSISLTRTPMENFEIVVTGEESATCRSSDTMNFACSLRKLPRILVFSYIYAASIAELPNLVFVMLDEHGQVGFLLDSTCGKYSSANDTTCRIWVKIRPRTEEELAAKNSKIRLVVYNARIKMNWCFRDAYGGREEGLQEVKEMRTIGVKIWPTHKLKIDYFYKNCHKYGLDPSFEDDDDVATEDGGMATEMRSEDVGFAEARSIETNNGLLFD
ncbi:hypothetical protein Tco_1386191 [Tanacetum coccineum]